MNDMVSKQIKGSVNWFLPFYLLAFLLFIACSESDDETTDEYANWQQRNEAFLATLEDSLRNAPGAWQKWKTYTKDEKTAGAATDYVYARQLVKGDGTVNPLYTDTVYVSYRGRLLPTATYPAGYVFDQTYVGNFDIRTTDVAKGAVSGFTDGFSTALQHMHKGDRYRIYVPYTLAYGTSGNSGSIPGYSTLVFDVVLIDFVTGTEAMVPWSSREL